MLFGVKILILLLILTPGPAFSLEIQFLTHSVDGKFLIDENGLMRGNQHGGRRAFNIELIREMMKIVNHQQKVFHQVPFIRGLREVQRNPNLAFFSVARKPDREDTVKWVGPIQVDVIRFYEASKYPKGIKNLEDARKVSQICVVLGTNNDEFLIRSGFNNLSRVTNYESCFKMLINGRVSITVAADAGLKEILEVAEIPKKLITASAVLYENKGYIAMSKNISDSEVHKWQEALEELRKSGKYNQLLKHYLNPE